MLREATRINDLEHCQPLFREFCKVQNLHDGGFYFAVDYISWVDELTFVKQLEIIRSYYPDFKYKNCNL